MCVGPDLDWPPAGTSTLLNITLAIILYFVFLTATLSIKIVLKALSELTNFGIIRTARDSAHFNNILGVAITAYYAYFSGFKAIKAEIMHGSFYARDQAGNISIWKVLGVCIGVAAVSMLARMVMVVKARVLRRLEGSDREESEVREEKGKDHGGEIKDEVVTETIKEEIEARGKSKEDRE